MSPTAWSWQRIKFAAVFVCMLSAAAQARGQLQVELDLKRVQYIAYEPILATIGITNLAGRDVDLHDADGQAWFGFEITGKEGEPIAPVTPNHTQPPLNIPAGKKVTQRINLTPLYPVHDFGTYHLRAHIYFADLNKFFYSQAKVFEVTDARPIWQRTVGVADGAPTSGKTRTYSLLSNRFPDHTALYVRVEDKDSGAVYATYSLGRSIEFGEPQAEIDQSNQLHVLHCAAPRVWQYSRVGLDGQLLAHSSFLETKTKPRLIHLDDGKIAVRGGMIETPTAQTARDSLPKLSDRPAAKPKED
ncbi:MAG TPA: hypothetical protein VE758_10160 [Chthoniobacterales bacterium]|nr:hypothetical protein [Chthoniobacterales bacterium]